MGFPLPVCNGLGEISGVPPPCLQWVRGRSVGFPLPVSSGLGGHSASVVVRLLHVTATSSVSQGPIYSGKLTCCHTEIEVVDQIFYLTKSEYTDTGPASPSADPISRGAWQGNHRICQFLKHWYDSARKNPTAQAGLEPRIFRSRGERLIHEANEAAGSEQESKQKAVVVWMEAVYKLSASVRAALFNLV